MGVARNRMGMAKFTQTDAGSLLIISHVITEIFILTYNFKILVNSSKMYYTCCACYSTSTTELSSLIWNSGKCVLGFSEWQSIIGQLV